MPSAPRQLAVSEAAEAIFFEHPELTAADWQRRLEDGRFCGQEIPEDVYDDLCFLASTLEDVAAGAAADGNRSGAGEAASRHTLHVSGRQGASYELLDSLGTGGHSVVYRALQLLPFERLVAIKVYYRSASDAAEIDNLRELRAFQRLQHPGVCQVLDAGITPWQQPFLVLELIEGSPLHRHLSDQDASYEQRLRLFDEILDVVAYAHSQGVVHRDLKPHNVLVHAASNRVKLIDFSIAGLAGPAEDAATSHTTAGYGTHEYQSPEQAGLIQHRIDARSDVYSLGCVLFELLTDERAFPREPGVGVETPPSLQARAAQAAAIAGRLAPHLRRLMPAPADPLSADVASVIEQCVQLQPADRFASIAELKSAVAALLAGQPVPLPRKAGRKPRWQAALIASSLAAAAVAAALMLAEPQRLPAGGLLGGIVGGEAAGEGRGTEESLVAVLASAPEQAVTVARVADRLAAIPPQERPAATSEVVEVAFENGWFEACATIIDTLAAKPSGSDENLLAWAEIMCYRVDVQVAQGDAATARAVAEPYVDELQQRQLLATTPEGLRLLGRFTDMLLAAFGAEGLAKAEGLLRPAIAPADAVAAFAPSAIDHVLYSGMGLRMKENDPQAALGLSRVFEKHCLAQAETKLVQGWAALTFRALLVEGRLDEALATVGKVVEGPHRLSVADGGKLVLSLVKTLERQNHADEALAMLSRFAVGWQPATADDAKVVFAAALKRAHLLADAGNAAQAVSVLHGSLDVAERWPEAVPVDARVECWHRLGDVEARRKHALAAVTAYRQALASLEDDEHGSDLKPNEYLDLADRLRKKIASLARRLPPEGQAATSSPRAPTRFDASSGSRCRQV